VGTVGIGWMTGSNDELVTKHEARIRRRVCEIMYIGVAVRRIDRAIRVRRCKLRQGSGGPSG
jgi:hypothetical protein